MITDLLKLQLLSRRSRGGAMLLAVAVVILVAALILPVRVPYSFTVPGKVLPAEEWLVTKSGNGQLMTVLTNNRTGVSESYSVAEFERGDNAVFRFDPHISAGCVVSRYDTVGIIVSRALELRLTSLRGELNVARSLLNQNLSGEKESMVREARSKLRLALSRAELSGRIFSRQRSMYEKKLVSDEEFEIAKSSMEVDKLSVEVAKAQLQTVLTGAKKEQIEVVRSEIAALESQVAVLERQSAGYNLTSPVDGLVRWLHSGDTLLSVYDTSSYVVLMPVPLIKRGYLDSAARITIIHPIRGEIDGVVLERIGSSIGYLSGKPVVSAAAVVRRSRGKLMPGLIVKCSVRCPDVTIVEFAGRIFSSETF